jgi:diphthamide biosynthesis protein 2
LPGLQDNKEPEAKEEEEAEYSFITGSMKKKLNIHSGEDVVSSTGSEVATRNNNQQLSTHWSPAATFLSQRTFKGLEQKLGETEVKKAVEGMAGIPMQYENEKKNEEKQ